MDWTADIVKTVVELLLATGDRSSEYAFRRLHEQVDAELRQRAQAWQAQNAVMSPEAYRAKYALTVEEVKTARELHILNPAGITIPLAFSSFVPPVLFQNVPLTPEQRQRVQENTYLSTAKAAEYLGISPDTLKASGIPASVPPWNRHGEYAGKFYRVTDLIESQGKGIPTEKKNAPTASQQAAWERLNERQRQYLLIIYREEKRKEPHYKSYAALDDPKRQGGEWRWCEHDTRSLDRAGLDIDIKAINELDQGTGSTYETLDRRGLIERRHIHGRNLLGQDIELLDVRLTRQGRALAKAFATKGE